MKLLLYVHVVIEQFIDPFTGLKRIAILALDELCIERT